MKQLLRYRALVLSPMAAALVGVALWWFYGLAEQLNVSAEGGPDPFWSTIGTFGVILFMVTVVAFVYGLASIFCRGRRYVAACCILASLSYCSTPFLVPQRDARLQAFHSAGERLMPLVEAIQRYYHDTGSYPVDLNQLMPKYLDQLPSTGMASYPKYRYVVGAEAQKHSGNPWIIAMDASYGMGFDEFLYYPLQNYPDTVAGNAMRRLGKWAYMIE